MNFDTFDRFASRNFHRLCVFSAAMDRQLATCPHALAQGPAIAHSVPSHAETSLTHDEGALDESTRVKSMPDKLFSNTLTAGNALKSKSISAQATRATSSPQSAANGVRFHCRSSTHQINCVLAMESAQATCSFILRSKQINHSKHPRKSVVIPLHAFNATGNILTTAERQTTHQTLTVPPSLASNATLNPPANLTAGITRDDATSESMQLGLLRAMRDTIHANVHPNVPVENISLLIGQTMGAEHENLEPSLQQRIVRQVSRAVSSA